MAICGRGVFGILAKINVCRQAFHATVLNAVYFGNKMNTIDRMYHAAKEQKFNK